ncbi:hypothetical protein NMG60_11019644 [Bertholletia excelsa]
MEGISFKKTKIQVGLLFNEEFEIVATVDRQKDVTYIHRFQDLPSSLWCIILLKLVNRRQIMKSHLLKNLVGVTKSSSPGSEAKSCLDNEGLELQCESYKVSSMMMVLMKKMLITTMMKMMTN